jgi:ATP adenylyltransferase
MKPVKYLVTFFVIFGVIALVIQNDEAFATKVVFKVNLLFASYESPNIPIYIISSIALILGFVFAWVYFMLDRFQLKRQINNLRKESREKDNELNSLRNLPITSENVTPDVQENDVEFT